MVVDDHPLVLRAIADLFRTEEEIEVAAVCASGEEALSEIGDVNPDVVILDYKLPELGGIDVLARLNGSSAASRIILLTAQMDDADALEAVRLGARGIVFKDQAPEDLIEAVRTVAGGARWLPPSLMNRALDAALRSEAGMREAGMDDPSGRLTPRETEVCRLVGRGQSNKRIARELGITEGTVKIHLNNVFRKLGVSSRLQVAVEARERGLR